MEKNPTQWRIPDSVQVEPNGFKVIDFLKKGRIRLKGRLIHAGAGRRFADGVPKDSGTDEPEAARKT